MFLNLCSGQNYFLPFFVFGFYSFAKNTANISVARGEGTCRKREAPDFSHKAAQKCPFGATGGGAGGWQPLRYDTWSWREADSHSTPARKEARHFRRKEERPLTLGFTQAT